MASAPPTTRNRVHHWLLGTPLSSQDADKFMLPTYGTLMRRIIYESQDQRMTENVINHIVEVITFELNVFWRQGGIPTFDDPNIKRKVRKLITEDLDYLKKQKTRREAKTPENLKWIEDWKQSKGFDSLFNIAKCQCYKSAKSTAEIMSGIVKCTCGYPIPKKDLLFFAHQLFERGKPICLKIGTVDPEAVRLQMLEEARAKRRLEEAKRLEEQRRRESTTIPRFGFTHEDIRQFEGIDIQGIEQEEEEFSDDDFGSGFVTKKKYCKVPYKRNALGALRYGDSTRSSRAQINWTVMELKDYNALSRHFTENVQELLISVDAFRDRQEKYGEELTAIHSQTSKRFVCLKFDGKKTKTLLKNSRSAVKEHIVVISEPGSGYLDHFVPASGKGATIANELYSLLIEYDSVESLLAIGADGTSANTGLNLGAIRQLELKVGVPIQWLICQLHYLELPLRHLIEKLDGKFSGPGSSKGPIGSIVTKKSKDWVQASAVVHFRGVQISQDARDIMENCLPQEYLNEEQLYFLNLWKACVKGNMPKQTRPTKGPPRPPLPLWSKLPGPVHLARWVTLAIAILRLRCQTANPTIQLEILVMFICNFYAPLYFKVKTDWHCINGARNFHLSIKLARQCLDKDKFEYVLGYIAINGYYGHPDNVLLSAVFDPDQNVRERAVILIREIRAYWHERPGFRQFQLHHTSIKWNAAHYLDLYDWNTFPKQHYCSPPLLRNFSNDDLWDHAKGRRVIKLPDIPVHSQAVERWVQDTAKAAETQIGHKKRHACLLNLEKNRQQFPTNARKELFM